MKNNRGVISVFALLAMMFFLIFIMVVYNNLAVKSKTQVETTGVLVDLYGSEETADSVFNQELKGGNIDLVNPLYKKSVSEKNKVNDLVAGEFIVLNSKIYKK